MADSSCVVPANCPSCVCYSAQCPTTKGGGRVCEFDCHPGELETAHLQQAARADPRVPGYLREAGKQRAPRAASDQGRHAVRSTGTVWGPQAGGRSTFPLLRGPGWLYPGISWPPLEASECGIQPCLNKANCLSLNCGLPTSKKFNQNNLLDNASLLPVLQRVPLSACRVLCRLQLEQIVFCQSGYKPLESFQ